MRINYSDQMGTGGDMMGDLELDKLMITNLNQLNENDLPMALNLII